MNKLTKNAKKLIISAFIVLVIFALFSALASSNINILTNGYTTTTITKDKNQNIQEIAVGNDDEIDISNVLYFLTGFTTAVLALIAYFNLESLNQTNKNKQLLQIDQRWGNHEIIKARQIIHIIYRTVCDDLKYEDPKVKPSVNLYENVSPVIGKIIIELSVSEKLESRACFIYLLNYLDLMESLAYIYRDADSKDIEELEAFCGETLVFNYGVFHEYIKFRNKKHSTKQDKYYTEFTNIMKKLKDTKKIDQHKRDQTNIILSNTTEYQIIKYSTIPEHDSIKKYLTKVEPLIKNFSDKTK